MTPEQYQRAKEILRLIEGHCADEHATILERECGEDAEFRAQVERFIEIQLKESDFLGEPVLGRLMSSIAEGIDADAAAEMSHPTAIGRYRIVRVLGRGGMGIVYEAEQDEPRRTVALKVIPRRVMSAEGLRRFRNEAHMLGRLHHPGIAQVYDSGTADTGDGDQPFMAMEYIRGVPLNTYVAEHDLSMRERLDLVARICDAVHHAHLNGVIHRDLKPGNILVSERGDPKVLDFGVARATDSDLQITTMMTHAGQLIGTVPYMSPEQVRGDPNAIDARCDVYALGVNLFELLSGSLPFNLDRRTIPEAVRIIQEDDPLRLSSMGVAFRGDVDTIVATAIEKNPQRRYQSAESLGADIRRFLNHEPIVARPVSNVYRLRKFMRRHKAIVGGVAATMIVLVIGVISTTMFALRANDLASEASENELRALEGEALARWTAYRANIASASSSLVVDDPRSAARSLRDAPEEFRNWEWDYLSARLDPVLAAMTFAGADDGSDDDRNDDPNVQAESSAQMHAGFLPGGTALIASVRDCTVQLTNLMSGETVGVFRAESPLRLPTLSPDGAWLAAISEPDCEVIIWSLDTGEELSRLVAPSPALTYLGFSEDGALIELRRESSVSVVEARTGRTVLTHELPEGARCTQAIFTGGGTRLIVAVHNRGTTTSASIQVLDIRTGEQLESVWFNDAAGGIALSPDGRTLAVGTSGIARIIRILDAQSLEEVAVLRGHSDGIVALSFAPSGERLLSASDDLLLSWDTTEWEKTGSHRLDKVGVASIACSPDGSRVIIADFDSDIAQLWDLNLDPARVLRGHPTYVYLVAFHPDGTMIASADYDQQMRLWDADTGESLAAISIAASSALAFTSDGSRLISAPGGPIMTIGDPAAWRETTERIEADSLFRLAPGGTKRVQTWVGEGSASSPDGTLAAEPQGGGMTLVRNLATGDEVRRIGPHGAEVHAVAISPDNALLATGGDDSTVQIWDLATGDRMAIMDGHLSTVYSIDFSPDGSRIVSGGNDNAILLWDVASHQPVAELHGHSSYVHSVAFSPDGTQIVSGSGDFTLRVWDALPRRARAERGRAAHAREAALATYVDRLIQSLPGPADVARHVRADEALSAEDRMAAVKILLRRQFRRDRGQ